MVLYLYIFFGGFEVRAHIACQPRATLESSLTVNVKTPRLRFISPLPLRTSHISLKHFLCLKSSQKFVSFHSSVITTTPDALKANQQPIALFIESYLMMEGIVYITYHTFPISKNLALINYSLFIYFLIFFLYNKKNYIYLFILWYIYIINLSLVNDFIIYFGTTF